MKSFRLQTEYLPILETLSDEAKGKLFHAIMVYASTGIRPVIVNIKDRDKVAFSTIYELISNRIEREASRNAEVSEARSIAGKASGRSRAAKKGG